LAVWNVGENILALAYEYIYISTHIPSVARHRLARQLYPYK